MIWIAGGLVTVCAALALVVAARSRDSTKGVDRDFGSISGSWLNERRARDRETDLNR
jgi:hypothetical protein